MRRPSESHYFIHSIFKGNDEFLGLIKHIAQGCSAKFSALIDTISIANLRIF